MDTIRFVQLSTLLLVTVTLTWGCDFSGDTRQTEVQTYSPEDIAAKHNEAVSQALENLRSTKENRRDSFELNRRTIDNALRETKTYAELNRRVTADQRMSDFKRHLREERGLSKKTMEDLGIDDLHRADMLSDAQMEYVDKIRGLETPSEVKRLAKNASQELGEAGTIVQIYAATCCNSLSYWQTHAAAVSELADDRLRAKGDIDWSSVAGADAGGAAAGAVGGAWSAVQSGAASASLTFGPQGAVVTITGSAISGAVAVGATASIAEAASQWSE